MKRSNYQQTFSHYHDNERMTTFAHLSEILHVYEVTLSIPVALLFSPDKNRKPSQILLVLNTRMLDLKSQRLLWYLALAIFSIPDRYYYAKEWTKEHNSTRTRIS